MHKYLYVRNPSSKRSSGRPDTKVGKVFLNCPKDQVRTWVEYQDSMQVSLSELLSALRNFSARHLVERKFTGEVGWYKQLSKMKICCVPASSMSRILTVPSWRQGSVLLAVVRLLFVCCMVSGMNFQMSLQMWPVVELSQTKKIESVSKWTCVFICSESTSAKNTANPCRFALLEMPEEYVWIPEETSPSEALKMLVSPSEAAGFPWIEALEMPPLEDQIWTQSRWHAIMDRIPKIPNIEWSTKNKEMSPWCGVFGLDLQSNLAPKERQEQCWMLWWLVDSET